MKYVYVLYGRKECAEGVYDHDGNYFRESPVLEVFDTYENAYKQFETYVIEAYRNVREYGVWLDLDETFIEETSEESLFNNYNFYAGTKGMSVKEFLEGYNKFVDELPDMSISWFFEKIDGERASWQIELEKNLCNKPTPILPGLYIEKKEIQTQ